MNCDFFGLQRAPPCLQSFLLFHNMTGRMMRKLILLATLTLSYGQCQDETRVFMECTNRLALSASDCMDCVERNNLQTPTSAPCAEQLFLICAGINTCAPCFGCMDEMERLNACNLQNRPSYTCPEVDCPCQMLTTTKIRCMVVNMDINAVGQCHACLTSAVPGGTSDQCDILERNACPSYHDCLSCAPCRDEILTEETCYYRSLGCPNFDCVFPTNEPTNLPTHAPTTIDGTSTATPSLAPQDQMDCAEAEANVDSCLLDNVSIVDGSDCQACVESVTLSSLLMGCSTLSSVCQDLSRCNHCGPCQPEIGQWLLCRSGDRNAFDKCQARACLELITTNNNVGPSRGNQPLLLLGSIVQSTLLLGALAK